MEYLDHTFECKSTTTVKNVVKVFEALLCFDAGWLMQDTLWDSSNCAQAIQSAHLSIEALLKMCKKCIPPVKENVGNSQSFMNCSMLLMILNNLGGEENCSQCFMNCSMLLIILNDLGTWITFDLCRQPTNPGVVRKNVMLVGCMNCNWYGSTSYLGWQSRPWWP